MAANTTAAPDRAEFEKILDRRDPFEAVLAAWAVQKEAEATALAVEAIVAAACGAKSHQDAADFLLGKAAPESRETGPEALEKTNFRIDSTGWEIRQSRSGGTRFKVNPEGDVTELLEGESAGEQHFTWDAAMRETAKAGKRMPTNNEWLEIVRSRHPDVDSALWWQDAPWIAEALGLPLAGYRVYSSAAYDTQGTRGYYWAASTTGTVGYVVYLSSTLGVVPSDQGGRAYGFSVRCLKN